MYVCTSYIPIIAESSGRGGKMGGQVGEGGTEKGTKILGGNRYRSHQIRYY